ncbi:MAG TPA: glycosyltransferase family 4 protein [Methylophilus sp.]
MTKLNNYKILFFVTEDWFVCSHWLPIIKAAKDAGFEVVVVTNVHLHADKILALGVRLIPFEMSRRGSNLLSELSTIYRLARVYRKERPTIVHHIAMKPMLYGSFIVHLLGVRHIVNWVSGLGWLFISNNWRAKVMRSLVKKTLSLLLSRTSVIVENTDDKAVMLDLGIFYRNLHLMRGAGVDTEVYAPKQHQANVANTSANPVVLLPSRMLWDKGLGEFVDAAMLLKKRAITARFVLVGSPDESNPASVSVQQLKQWHEEGAVEWWGRREDMPQVFAASNIVCLPSYREGLPKALLEAASCGLPIVTTDVPGCREVVSNGDNGYLVPSHDSIALANALESLIRSPDLAEKMGARGRTRVLNEFSQEIIQAQVVSLYKKLIA